MLRRCIRRLGSTNRYTDGSGRKLESNELPRDLYLETISNRAYPVKGEHWQPVVAGKPSPQKGSVIISGAGVLGLTLGSLFALRGWHTTVLERSPRLPKQANFHEFIEQEKDTNMHCQVGSKSHSNGIDNFDKIDSHRTPHRVVSYGKQCVKLDANTLVWSLEEGSSLSTGFHQDEYYDGVKDSDMSNPCQQACSPFQHPFIDLEYTVLTRRAVDVLEIAGVRLGMIQYLGVPVSGILDHPGDYNSWLTYGLTEHHPFAVRMLSIDLFALRRYLEDHVNQLPNQNLQVFYEHVIEAVYPLRQQVAICHWEKSTQSVTNEMDQMLKGAAPLNQTRYSDSSNNLQDRTTKVVFKAKAQPQRRRDTSLMLSPMKWDAKYADDAVDYDLLICAEGVNSRLRDLLDVEGFATDIDMGTKWFLLRSDTLSHEHIHRWLRKRKTNPVTTVESYHVCSAYQVPMCIAFPRIDGNNLFSVMVYMPIGELEALSDEEVLKYFLADVAHHDPNAELRSFTPYIRHTPTIFCENLFNSVGLPSAVMVGDAGHSCHPFWMQGLALGLEDGINLLNQVDAYSRHFYDAVKQYSNERGVDGDALRALTDRCLYYQRQKHRNPFIRFQNAYQFYLSIYFPRRLNDLYNGSTNHLYSKSIETMLNGRGYTSYEFAEKQQVKHISFFNLGRLYT
ncbi:unnamed protein product [Phytomonas sp. Hart1]|nr:unnamed protein product [Phytomonas sp. Hart1]|eukprot:CCW67766.1 unnamed protein product [Phytomonas sp. isolate Hart1]